MTASDFQGLQRGDLRVLGHCKVYGRPSLVAFDPGDGLVRSGAEGLVRGLPVPR